MEMICLKGSELWGGASGFHFASLAGFNVTTLPHTHDFHEVFAVERGRVRHALNGVEETLSAGAVRWIHPRDRHHYVRLPGVNADLFNLAFSSDWVGRIAAYLGIELPLEFVDGGLPWASLAQMEPSELAALSTRLRRASEVNAAGDSKRIRCEALSVLTLLASASMEAGEAPSKKLLPEWLAHVVSKAKGGLFVESGLPGLLKAAGRSHSHVCRELTRLAGTTPTALVNDARLDRAVQLLRSGDQKVAMVALECGFQNLSHFNHLFSERFGMPPSAFRTRAARKSIPF
jgi:AraC family cel operon transcriptional repressor